MKKPRKKKSRRLGTAWESYRQYCVRPKGQDGWQFKEADCERDDFIKRLQQQGIDDAEVVEVGRGGWRVGITSSHDDYSAKLRGWCFDEQGNCWRAPDETLLPFLGEPLAVDSIAATFGLPDAGWIDTRLTAGERSVVFSLSNLWDPIGDIVKWLERLLDGGYPRLMIDMEGWFCEFHTFPTDGGIRFAVVVMEFGRKVALDIRIDRTALVSGLYQPLVSYWEGDAFAQAWREWDFISRYDIDDDDLDAINSQVLMSPNVIRSTKIDAALADCGSSTCTEDGRGHGL